MVYPAVRELQAELLLERPPKCFGCDAPAKLALEYAGRVFSPRDGMTRDDASFEFAQTLRHGCLGEQEESVVAVCGLQQRFSGDINFGTQFAL